MKLTRRQLKRMILTELDASRLNKGAGTQTTRANYAQKIAPARDAADISNDKNTRAVADALNALPPAIDAEAKKLFDELMDSFNAYMDKQNMIRGEESVADMPSSG